jgi:HD superfamily phosphodiesterase
VFAATRRQGARRTGAHVEVDRSHPNSAATTRAVDVLNASSPPWLVNHGYRTFAWAMALAVRDDLRPNREILFCAALLHDIGLTASYAPSAGNCFAVSGALGAQREMLRADMSDEHARQVANAIALHVNITVALDAHGTEAHLLRAGAGADVIGQNLRAIDSAYRNATLLEFPRLAFKASVSSALLEQSKTSPHTRIGMMCRHFQFARRIQTAPFDS